MFCNLINKIVFAKEGVPSASSFPWKQTPLEVKASNQLLLQCYESGLNLSVGLEINCAVCDTEKPLEII